MRVTVFRPVCVAVIPELKTEFAISAETMLLPIVAAALGVTVVYAPFRGRAYGWFNPQARTITLASPDVPVFFHELAHAVHHELSYASNNPHLAAGTSGHH